MRRWILKAGATNLDGLVLEDAPMPEPGEGEVRIRVHAVSLNYRDQLVLGGGLARLPTTEYQFPTVQARLMLLAPGLKLGC